MKNFFLAARPKTLIVSIAPPLVAYFYVLKNNPNAPIYLLICTMLSALFIQMATNFFNDLIDHQKGSDKIRLGPKRVTASGLVSEKSIQIWAYGSITIALLLAIPLIIRGGPWIFFLGVISIYLSYGYTGGIVSLAYRGLGEIFVFLFFGLFAFLGSEFLFSLDLTFDGLIYACQFGFLAVTFIGINNLRDREQDNLVNKKTLATRMKESNYRSLVAATIISPYLLNLFLSLNYQFNYLAFLFAIPFTRIIYMKNGQDLNVCLKLAAIHLIIFSLLTILDLNNGTLF